MDITPYAGAIATIAVAVIGSYFAQKSASDRQFAQMMAQNAAMTAEIKALKEQVEKHNNVLERVYKLETNNKTLFKIIDELRERDEKIEGKIDDLKIGGTE